MTLKLTDPLLHLKPITKSDEEVLCQIYSSTRTEELSRVTNWSTSQKKAFLQAQFTAQHSYYQNNYTGAHFWVIEYRSQIIGRLYLHTHYPKNSMRIIDIALLPEWRNKGIGKQIIMDVMEFAAAKIRTVTIHVESFNPAMNMYKKLGFELVSKTNDVYHLLEWKNKNLDLQESISFKQSATNGRSITAFNCL